MFVYFLGAGQRQVRGGGGHASAAGTHGRRAQPGLAQTLADRCRRCTKERPVDRQRRTAHQRTPVRLHIISITYSFNMHTAQSILIFLQQATILA